MTPTPHPANITEFSWDCLLWASFQYWFFGFLFLCNISRLSFCPPPHFLGIIRFWSSYSRHPNLFCIPELSLATTDFAEFWDPNRKQGLPGSRNSWGDGVHSGYMQPGVLDPSSSLRIAYQLTCLTETLILPLGKRYFQILYYFSKQHSGSSVFNF